MYQLYALRMVLEELKHVGLTYSVKKSSGLIIYVCIRGYLICVLVKRVQNFIGFG
jgi:hypothetical protein